VNEILTTNADGLDAPEISRLLATGIDGARRLGTIAAERGLGLDELIAKITQTGVALADLELETIGAMALGHTSTCPPLPRRSIERLTIDMLRLVTREHVRSSDTGELDLDAMLHRAMLLIADALGCDACSLLLHNPYQDTLILRATHGLNPDAVGNVVIRTDTGISGLAATTRKTQIAPVAREHPRYLRYPMLDEGEMVSHMSVPLLLRDPERLIGVLNLQSRTYREFSGADQRFVETAMEDLALGIQSARLYSRSDAVLAQRLRDVQMLQSATRAINGTLQPDELGTLVARLGADLVDASTAVLVRCTPELEFSALHTHPATADQSDGAWMLIAHEVCASRVATARRAGGSPGALYFAAPLTARDELLGVLVARLDRPAAPSPGQLSMFQALADTAALAISNAELYDETRRVAATSSALLQEMHHRVRNNLQIVAALLSLQARTGRDEAWSQPLLDAVARIQSIASIHDLMSHADVELATIDTIARTVVDEATVNAVPPGLDVRFVIEGGSIEVSSRQAMILGLLINECVTNALVHGFTNRTDGTVTIRAEQHNGIVELAVEDDGAGLGADDPTRRQSGLGTRIAARLAESDLKGFFTIEPREPSGTRAKVTFPLQR
jgi:two-component sensor histidine kinase/putative methionine-R-sulfoxide reductase with GAF domain